MSEHIKICLPPLFTKMVPVSSLFGIYVLIGLIFDGFRHIFFIRSKFASIWKPSSFHVLAVILVWLKMAFYRFLVVLNWNVTLNVLAAK